MTIVLPALSEDGWVDYPAKQIDYLFSHFFLSDYSQTYIYKDQVSSFAKVIQDNQGDPSKIARMLSLTLNNYFGHYFPVAESDCTAKEHPDNPNQYELYLYMRIVDHSGKEYSLGRMLNVKDSKIENVITLSNYGDDLSQSFLV